jgi:hypothetical protein
MEIIIASENPKAITTSDDLTLRLEMFLMALVRIPKLLHLSQYYGKKTTKNERPVEGFLCA